MLEVLLPLVLVLGFANQSGSTCAVLAAEQVVSGKGYSKLAGFALAAGVALLAAQVLHLPGSSPRMPGWPAVLGGVISALGASLNGRCAMGTIADLSSGNAARLATLGGFMAGAALALGLGAKPAAAATMQAVEIMPSAVAIGLALAAIGLGWRLAHTGSGPSPLWMALIGALSVGLMTLDPNWAYTSHLSAIAKGEEEPSLRFALVLAMLIGGGAIAALRAGRWKPRVAPAREWLRDGAGGALLGFGAALVPGSNDTMLLVGIPQLLPHLLLAYACFWATLLALRWRSARWTS